MCKKKIGEPHTATYCAINILLLKLCIINVSYTLCYNRINSAVWCRKVVWRGLSRYQSKSVEIDIDIYVYSYKRKEKSWLHSEFGILVLSKPAYMSLKRTKGLFCLPITRNVCKCIYSIMSNKQRISRILPTRRGILKMPSYSSVVIS